MPFTSAVPEVGLSSPMIIRMVVDLPDPFGPRKPGDHARGHLEAQVVDGHGAAVSLGQSSAAIMGHGKETVAGEHAATGRLRLGIAPLFRRGLSGRRLVAHRLDVVPVGITDEGAEVVLVILGEDAWGVQDLGPDGHGRVGERRGRPGGRRRGRPDGAPGPRPAAPGRARTTRAPGRRSPPLFHRSRRAAMPRGARMVS